MPTWNYDSDGLIHAAAQKQIKHPCEYVSATSELDNLHGHVESTNIRDKSLLRLAYGTYIECSRWNALSAFERFQLQIKALVKPGSGTIITGEAAAALHGIPVLVRNATIALANSGLRRPGGGLRHVGGRILEQDIVRIGGRCVTDVPKTVIDICRTAESENGPIIVDTALRQWCDLEELHTVLTNYPRSPGTRRARELLRTASAHSETIGESITKKCIIDSGIATLYDEKCVLMQQVEFYDSEGFIGRVDFYVPHLNLIIEFDGLIKYSGGGVAATETVLLKEQAREKRLRNLHLDVLRFQWSQVINGDCVEVLRQFAIRQRQRIQAGGLVFSSEVGRFRQATVPYKDRQLRESRIQERKQRLQLLENAPASRDSG